MAVVWFAVLNRFPRVVVVEVGVFCFMGDTAEAAAEDVQLL